MGGSTDVAIQVGILILGVLMFFFIQHLPKRALSRIKSKNRTTIESNRHFIQGTQFLSRAKSAPSKNKTHSQSLAKQALTEAETAFSLSPKDPGPLILKSLALEFLGHKLPALRAIDSALTSPRVDLLSERERGDALVKRAELKLAVNRRRRVDSAMEDLKEASGLCQEGDLDKVFCLLGQCYELKGMSDEAKWAFEKAQPNPTAAREGLRRLGP